MKWKDYIGKWNHLLRRGKSAVPTDVAATAPPAERPPAEVLEALLTQLQAPFTTSEEEESRDFRFSFQGGHFVVSVPKNGGSTTSVEFPFVYTVTPEHVGTLRTWCNHFNMVCRTSKFIYSFDPSDNTYGAHISTPCMLCDGMPRHELYFRALLETMFDLRREFVYAVEKAMKEEPANGDGEAQSTYHHRLDYLLREQEIDHQSEAFQVRRSQAATLRLSDMLDLCFGIHDPDFAYMKMVDEERVSFEFDQQKIAYFDLKAHAADLTCFVYYNDENSRMGALRMVQLTMRQEYDDDVATYFRLSAILHPSVYGSQSAFVSGRTGLESLTFLIAVDKKDEQQYRAEYEFLWADALDKKDGHRDQLTPEQQFLLDADAPDAGYWLHRGRQLYAASRYYEAIDYLTIVFFYLNDEYDQLSSSQRRAFREISFLIGFCYMEVQLYAEAYYFLDIVHDVHNIKFTEEYVNCLVNSNDFRAAETIDRLLSFVQSLMAQNDDEDADEFPAPLSQFQDFLRRRRVYVMVNKDQLDEAEAECHTMLSEPSNADFAIDELAYIQKLRRAQSEA